MSRPRVLICHPGLYPQGGGNEVAAWGLQALREDFAVGLGTLHPVDLPAINRAFGTSLLPRDFELLVAPARYRAAIRCLPTPGALLEASLTVRWALELDRRHRYQLLFSTSNEAGFDRPGMQYVHYPWAYFPRPDIELRPIHRIPGLLTAYRRACLWLARGTWEGLRRNHTLANSEFTAGRIREVHGIDSEVVYPPVPGDFPTVPWVKRRLAAAAVGRLHPCKRWHMAVEMVDLVRRRGHDLALTVIGHPDDEEYGKLLDRLAATRPWFRIERSPDRRQLIAALGTHRYGIHTMEDEHFGIAPAELQRAGCIPFVHNSGGAVEIVACDPRLTFEDATDGAEKLAQAIEDPDRERDLLAQVAARRDWFSSDRFCQEIQQATQKCLIGV